MTDDKYNFYDNAPRGYALCLNGGCASAESCLRRLAGRDLGLEPRTVSTVNPRLADARGEGACPFFRKAERVRVAFGFTADDMAGATYSLSGVKHSGTFNTATGEPSYGDDREEGLKGVTSYKTLSF